MGGTHSVPRSRSVPAHPTCDLYKREGKTDREKERERDYDNRRRERNARRERKKKAKVPF